jgi:hypothetical protein
MKKNILATLLIIGGILVLFYLGHNSLRESFGKYQLHPISSIPISPSPLSSQTPVAEGILVDLLRQWYSYVLKLTT